MACGDLHSLPTTPARAFARALEAALAHAKLYDTSTIGALVANAQENPERDGIPYHPAVVEAWLEGRLIPSPSAFDAMHDMLADTLTPAQSTELQSLFDAADMRRPSRTTEFAVTFGAKVKQTGLSLEALAQALSDAGAPVGGTIASGKVLLCKYGIGQLRPTDQTLRAFDRICADHEVPPPSMQQLRDVHKKHNAEEAIELATADTAQTTFGQLLRSCRNRLGLSLHKMSDALTAEAGSARPISHATVNDWEHGRTLPTYKCFPAGDIVSCYGTLMRAADDASPNEPPWWSPQKETELTTALKAAKQAAAERDSKGGAHTHLAAREERASAKHQTVLAL